MPQHDDGDFYDPERSQFPDDDRPRRRRPRDDDDERDLRRPARTSLLGVASSICALMAGVFLGVLIVSAGLMAANAGGKLDEQSPEAIVVGCGIFIGIGLALLGLILGIVAVITGGGSQIFGVLGIVGNGLIVLGTIGLILIGLTFG